MLDFAGVFASKSSKEGVRYRDESDLHLCSLAMVKASSLPTAGKDIRGTGFRSASPTLHKRREFSVTCVFGGAFCSHRMVSSHLCPLCARRNPQRNICSLCCFSGLALLLLGLHFPCGVLDFLADLSA